MRSLAVLVLGEEDLSERETGRRLNEVMTAQDSGASKDKNPKNPQ